jgi:thiol-disulfide isomerase/thioredoxin
MNTTHINRSPLARVRAFTIAVFSFAMCILFTDAARAAETGKPLPELKGFALEGSVPATQGKVALVDFWASWCGPCKKSFPALESLYQQYKAQGLVVVGVSVDEDAAAMKNFLRQHAVSFSIARDASHKLVEAVKVGTMPTTLLVDRHGVIRFVHSGFHSGEEAALGREIEQLLHDTK